jgi:hypothetical protein
MSGLCWMTEDGSKEGIFKDVNAGIAQWRGQAPDSLNSYSASSVVGNNEANHKRLSNKVSQMAFEATDYTITDDTAEITGVLTIEDHRQAVVLDIEMPAISMNHAEQNLIALTASTEISTKAYGHVLAIPYDQTINLCLMMQAVKTINVPDPSSGQPLMLSHYY